MLSSETSSCENQLLGVLDTFAALVYTVFVFMWRFPCVLRDEEEGDVSFTAQILFNTLVLCVADLTE